jgi:hypothetical protein
MSVPSTDTDELARFGYKQELDRSLGGTRSVTSAPSWSPG